MEGTALEQTLRDHPEDLAAWRAYGEQLRERGDARGTLIQLEQRRSSVRPADRGALDEDCQALLTEHQQAWDAGLPPGVTVMKRRFGFATKVRVPLSDDAPELIEQALREPFVTGLRIDEPAAGKPNKWYGQYDEEDLADSLEDWDPVADDPVIHRIDAGFLAGLDLGRLVELDLSYLPIGAPGAALLASTAHSRLEELDLRYCVIGDAGLAALAASLRFDGLRRLHLQSNGITSEGVRSLALFDRLVELDLRYNTLGTEGVQALLEAPFVGFLRKLLLYRADVSEEGADKLASAARLHPVLRSYWRSV